MGFRFFIFRTCVLLFCLHDNFFFQHYLILLGSNLATPGLLATIICAEGNIEVTSIMLGNMLFACGICTRTCVLLFCFDIEGVLLYLSHSHSFKTYDSLQLHLMYSHGNKYWFNLKTNLTSFQSMFV
jgi:hypothetical protein